MSGRRSAPENEEVNAGLREALAERYEIRRTLGVGGSAIVYAAEDRKHGRSVAIKVLHPEIAASLGAARFAREIELAARLQHPNIVPLYESGEAAGGLYYVMPLVEGDTVRDRLEREGRLSVQDAVRITSDVAHALGYAHAHGVVHRDIKPANILLTAGAASVADFGIARVIGALPASRITGTGLAIGTPHYMSPEQAEGTSEVGPGSDIYSLACVTFETLTGTPPFGGPTTQAIIAGHWSGEIPYVSEVNRLVPSAVDAVLRRALAKRPEDRHATAEAFADELGRAATEGTTSVRAALARAIRRRRGTAAAVAAVGVLTVAVAAWATLRGDGDALPRVVVMPFEIEGETDRDFAEGMVDEISDRMASISGITLISRSSAARYDRRGKSVRDIGRDFGARYVLDGVIRHRRGTGAAGVRIVSALSDAESDQELWSEPFDASMHPDSLLQIQTRIAQRVVDQTHVKLLPREATLLRAARTSDPEAYAFYLRGLAFQSRRYDPEAIRRAGEMFRSAVETDPKFALAHAKLADVEIFAFRQFDRSPGRLDRARRAVADAIALDSSLAEARLARATLAFWLVGDAAAIERDLEFVRGIRPNDAEMLWMLGTLQRRQAHWERAIATFERARELNPRSELYCIELAGTHMMRRDYDRALRYVDTTIALAPQSLAPYLQQSFIHSLLGDSTTAARVIAESVSRFGAGTVLALVLPRFRDVLGRSGGVLFAAVDSLRMGQLSIDSGAYYLAKAEVRTLARRPGAAAYYDSARAVWSARVRLQPGESVAHMELAYSLAGLGRREEALSEAAIALALNPPERDAWSGVIRLDHAMRVAAAVGADSLVLVRVGELLARPSTLSRSLIRVDAAFARLRTDPRFRKLASGG